MLGFEIFLRFEVLAARVFGVGSSRMSSIDPCDTTAPSRLVWLTLGPTPTVTLPGRIFLFFFLHRKGGFESDSAGLGRFPVLHHHYPDAVVR